MRSQNTDYCAADPVTVEIDSQNRMPGDAQLYTPKVYNMIFWAIYRTDGSSDYTVAEKECLEVIANMNREFNKFNIFFKYRGVNYLFNDTAYNPNSTSNVSSFANMSGNFDPNSLNTYIYNDSSGFSGFYAGGRNVYVRSFRFNDYHTVHELGHMFGLSHTWSGMYEYDPNDQVQSCEHVTRSVGNSNFNADTRGDRVIDTDAMQRFSKTPGDTNYVDPNSCDYLGNGRDCQDNEFLISNDSSGTLNFMNDGSECPTTSYSQANDDEGFTIQQGLKMRLKIEAVPTRFGPAETSFESLFEPYKGAYATPGQGKPHFQPGFTYKFIECDGDYPQPAPYGDTFIFNQNIVKLAISSYGGQVNNKYQIIHPNRSAIVIEEINDSFNGFQTEKCYDNPFAKSSSGKVTKFNDNTFNYNVTIIPKDSLQINDPELIETLPNGLYKIEKTYNDGTVEETVIQKGNN